MKIGIDYIGTSAGAIIKNKENKYFLAQRGKEARDDINKWEFPGGSINLFEIRKDAINRIILEKYGFKIEVIKLLDVYDVVDKQAQDHWISTTFICKYTSGNPKIINTNKCQKIGWFSLEEIDKMDLSRITKINLKDINKLYPTPNAKYGYQKQIY
jgi:mutator protein MutT